VIPHPGSIGEAVHVDHTAVEGKIFRSSLKVNPPIPLKFCYISGNGRFIASCPWSNFSYGRQANYALVISAVSQVKKNQGFGWIAGAEFPYIDQDVDTHLLFLLLGIYPAGSRRWPDKIPRRGPVAARGRAGGLGDR
jgi:hypothetical protein